jgi:hypothetical protein
MSERGEGRREAATDRCEESPATHSFFEHGSFLLGVGIPYPAMREHPHRAQRCDPCPFPEEDAAAPIRPIRGRRSDALL